MYSSYMCSLNLSIQWTCFVQNIFIFMYFFRFIFVKLAVLKELGLDYLFVAAVDTSVDVLGSKAALKFSKAKNIPALFFSFVNSAKGN